LGDTAIPKISSLSPGTYEYYVSQKSNVNGCESKRSKLMVTVKRVPDNPQIRKEAEELVSSASSGNQWYLEGAPINGANSQKLKPIQNGNYTVKVVSEGCESEFSEKFNFLITGVVELDNGQYIKLFPNPVAKDGGFNIEWKLNLVSQILVEGFDMSGRKIIKRSLNGNRDTLRLPPGGGKYIIKVSWGNGKSQVFTLMKD
jgi:hypothetical protein